jgi:hypothetical protein
MWAKCSFYGDCQYLFDSAPSGTRTLQYLNLGSHGEDIGQEEVAWIDGVLASGGTNWANVKTFSRDRWYHIAVVWKSIGDNKSNLEIYCSAFVDSKVYSENVPVSVACIPDHWYFGRRCDLNDANTWERWRGQIDEYAVWNKALQTDEIAWLSANSITGLPEPNPLLLAATGLVGAWGRRLWPHRAVKRF